MESLVYENSPLADYLEGSWCDRKQTQPQDSRVPCLGEGENEASCPVGETRSEDGGEGPTSNFGPRGASRFQHRVRNKLPKPLDLRNTRHGEVVEKLYSACSVWLYRPSAGRPVTD